jgi:tRNA (guanine26-N2/guanine27-N2)-dimethyltransferase
MRVREGGVGIEVPEGDGVFFNPDQELNRDLTVAVLRAYREREPRAETYLDAMAATGIRGVRAANDGWEATLCDWDDAAVERCRANLARNDLNGEVENRNVNALLHERGVFDVVDLDPYGTPIPYADAAFANARNLVCVTATDTAPLCGAHFESGVRKYGAVPRNTDYHPEMGLRILLSALARTAARYDVGVVPVFSHATRHYVRTYLELAHSATESNEAIDRLGYLDHCEDCLHREATHGLIADPWEGCPNCGSDRVLVAGPVWLGSVRDRAFAERVGERVDGSMGATKRARRLVDALGAELDTPTHYDQHRLCKEWGRPAESMDEFLGAIRDAGFEASRAHYHGTAFKTTASVAEIRGAIERPCT